jgi:hypothetical protein
MYPSMDTVIFFKSRNFPANGRISEDIKQVW